MRHLNPICTCNVKIQDKIVQLLVESFLSEDTVLSVRQGNFSSLFPLSENAHLMTTRNPERYVVKTANIEQMRRSAVPFLQRLLNEDICKQKKDLSRLLQVNNGILFKMPPSLT